jgi:iron uptake system EfeUOB component EfeO/EfeM
VNVFERNIQTKANISGGTMTGSNERKVSDALITLTNQLTYKVSEIRIHLGGFISGVSLLNEIDAVKMTGSETLTQSAYEVTNCNS